MDQIHIHIDIGDSEDGAVRYAFQVLLASVEARLVFHKSVPYRLPPDAVLITYSRSRIVPTHRRHLVICASQRLWDHYGSVQSVPSSPSTRIPLLAVAGRPSARLHEPLVLPYVSEVGSPTVEVTRDPSRASFVSIVTGADLIASAFFWITCYEETLIHERDDVGRVPQACLRVIREGLTRRPLVDEYSELLITWLEILGLQVRVRRAPFRVAVTHDVDAEIAVKGFWKHAENGLRTLYRETVRQRRPRTAMLGLGQWSLRGLGIRDEATVFRDIVNVDAEFGFRSFFFLMANGTHRRDADYDIESEAVQSVLKAIREAGGSIGLHVGLDAHKSLDQLQKEWARLRRAAPQARPVARSHYLAFFAPTTWRQLRELGFMVDSTLGFNDRIGFRCGTCHGFRPFDIERKEVLPIWELPLTIMDMNLFHQGYERLYERATDTVAISDVGDLAGQVRAHGGCLVINWHNTACFGAYQKVYRAILSGLTDAQGVSPEDAPVDEGIVIW